MPRWGVQEMSAQSAIARCALLVAAIVVGGAVAWSQVNSRPDGRGGATPSGPAESGRSASQSKGKAARSAAESLGLTLEDATPERGLALDDGAYVAGVAAGSSAARAGLEAGDLIFRAGGQSVRSAAALIELLENARAAAAAGDTLSLRWLRGEALQRGELALREDAPDSGPQPNDPNDPNAGPPSDGRALATAPFLMIESRGHTDFVKGLIFHPDGERMITSGQDRSIRVWNWRTGELLRVIRGPSTASYGEIYAIALSPDGQTLAAGGFFAQGFGVDDDKVGDVRLIDLATGEILKVLRGHRNGVNTLAFSPDGALLLSGSGDTGAIIWDVETGEERHSLYGHGAEVYTVAFSSDGSRAVTSSLAGELRLWDARTGAAIGEPLSGHAHGVYHVAVSSQGLIASGDESGEIRLWDERTGESRGVLATGSRGIGALAFSPDGGRLLATMTVGKGPRIQIVYDVQSGAELARQEGHSNVVAAADWGPDDTVATGGGSDNEILIWDAATGAARGAGALESVGSRVWSTGFSADGRRIGWGLTWRSTSALAQNPIEFAIELPLEEGKRFGAPQAVTDGQEFARAVLNADGVSLSHGPGGGYGYPDAVLEIARDGGGGPIKVVRQSIDGYRHVSYSVIPGRRIVSGGGHGYVLAYDYDGRQVGRFEGHSGDVWATTPSPDGRLLLTGGSDQTVRLWNLESYELILTFFATQDGSYIAWTPQGYYDYYTAPGAERPDARIGWLLNYGHEETPGYVSARQLGPVLHRPNLIARAVQLASAEAAIAEAIAAQKAAGDARRPLPESVEELLVAPPPTLDLIRLGQDELQPLSGGEAVVAVRVGLNGAAPTSLALEAKVSLVQNGEVSLTRTVTAVPAPDAIELTEEMLREARVSREEVRLFRIPIFKGANEIEVTARTENGVSLPNVTVLTYADAGRLDQTGKLRILAIGVEFYDERTGFGDLSFPADDARAFAATAAEIMGQRHEGEAEIRLIVSDPDASKGETRPTGAEIRAGLAWLQAAGETDTSILFIAGHGAAVGDDYFILPTDYALTAQGYPSGALPWADIEDTLRATPGTKLLFLDACRSDGAFNSTLDADAIGAIHIYSSTSDGGAALERRNIEGSGRSHGLFTYALLRSLEGEAFDGRGRLYTPRLGVTIQDRVADLSGGAQIPSYDAVSGKDRILLAQR